MRQRSCEEVLLAFCEPRLGVSSRVSVLPPPNRGFVGYEARVGIETLSSMAVYPAFNSFSLFVLSHHESGSSLLGSGGSEKLSSGQGVGSEARLSQSDFSRRGDLELKLLNC
ncbi:Uncharacterized protein Rs2_13306 [Raphanus sativus]|nr:Uncharacterized protein Rs2_13306 [Raphanus sativus]